jgi:hypothetical protein
MVVSGRVGMNPEDVRVGKGDDRFNGGVRRYMTIKGDAVLERRPAGASLLARELPCQTKSLLAHHTKPYRSGK